MTTATAEEAVRTTLQVHDAARDMNKEYGYDIFDAPEVGFIEALKELGWVLVRRDDT